MCVPEWCGETTRIRARAPTCVPIYIYGRFREPEPKQRDLAEPYARVPRHTPYLKREARQGHLSSDIAKQ
jgi:hypothetical protein